MQIEGGDVDNELDGKNTGDGVKIGAAHHRARGLMIGAGILILVGAMAAFYKTSASSDEPKLKVLADFRAAYAAKCDAEDFRGEISPFLKSEFLNSTRLQDEVGKQASLLSSGQACADIDHALRAASYPMGAKQH